MNKEGNIKNVSFKIDADLLTTARSILKQNGYTLSKGLTLFLKNVAVREEVPLETEEDLENERLFLQLKNEIKTSLDEVQSGSYYTDEDLVERYGL
ncbi:type II toxin-antitoxin system RelB/ParD family antitoxin [Streptococcus sp. DD12]|uniref:type II toxin-antitoxin system RelB/ParD family antitoxin n=1 Tax=Streptococcus sp. DD12 TaxID=1777880 RepID=UPI0007925CB6|nr:type II toxin-antitoxin system RelB/DinJ family antitoxin [Streptococcus sp. DD12]KXT76850.1 DNA-damage-inducible protein J [Streptococcus sp. DD12]